MTELANGKLLSSPIYIFVRYRELCWNFVCKDTCLISVHGTKKLARGVLEKLITSYCEVFPTLLPKPSVLQRHFQLFKSNSIVAM